MRDRAQAMADKLKAPDLRMGYDLGLATARAWGLYTSTSRGTTSIGIEEPADLIACLHWALHQRA